MKTILILEDNAREMERLVKIVRQQEPHYEVVGAGNLKQAYHLAMEQFIDLFLLDIILEPGISGDASGMTFADNIRGVERYRFTPIIFITALEDPELYAYSELNCYRYVEKPYEPERLITLIQEALATVPDFAGMDNMYYSSNGGIRKLRKRDIVYIENSRAGRIIHTTEDDRYMPYKTMRDILLELNSDDFVQCNRFVIVNRNYVETLDPVNRYITLKERKETVEIGLAFKKSFIRRVLE